MRNHNKEVANNIREGQKNTLQIFHFQQNDIKYWQPSNYNLNTEDQIQENTNLNNMMAAQQY